MKKTGLLYCLTAFFLLTSFADINNIEFAVQNKIADYLSLFFNIPVKNIQYEFKNLPSHPDYDLFELSIINSRFNTTSAFFDVKINDFFNKNKYEILRVKVWSSLDKFKQTFSMEKNKSIRIVYKIENITIFDQARLRKFSNTDIITVENSFGKLLKCRLVSHELAEVIE